MTEHSCEPPVDPINGPEEWTCPCGRVWERREETNDDIPGFYDTWFQPKEDR
ncbi:hypothetical protein [Streptosporangium sandarakinum]